MFVEKDITMVSNGNGMWRRQSIRTAAVFGGVATGVMLVVGSPAVGVAAAHGHSTESGDAVGRPGLDNPAPGLRVVQALGDRVYNQNTPLNRAFDNSASGVYYHDQFGTPNYAAPTHGDNGKFPTLLNSNIAGGAPRTVYNGAQGLGARLPDEEDLPGTAVRALSGIPKSSGDSHARSASATNCTSASARTTVHAQGSC